MRNNIFPDNDYPPLRYPRSRISDVDTTPEVMLVILFLVAWVCGIAVAKGFWSTFFSIVLFPYAWVILAEHFLL